MPVRFMALWFRFPYEQGDSLMLADDNAYIDIDIDRCIGIRLQSVDMFLH